MEACLDRHRVHGEHLHAYKHLDAEGALAGARRADETIAQGGNVGAFHGIPISVKDLYGVNGLPTFAGTPRQLPASWSTDAWLVARLRSLGAIPVGKTHMVELAFGAVGTNPHWGTPWNPWDEDVQRIPGGSSCGAGVSLWEGSALLALGSDTGGSIRIPASMTGTVGHKPTWGRWSVDGVVPLSHTLDSVGPLTRSVADAVYFFGSVDPAWGDSAAFLRQASATEASSIRIVRPQCLIWDDCQSDIKAVLESALDEVEAAGMPRGAIDGSLLDRAYERYMRVSLARPECRAFLERELPGWIDILHPTVGKRLEGAVLLDAPTYLAALDEHRRFKSLADGLFTDGAILALPTAIITPPSVAEVSDLDRYMETNGAALRPTCCGNMLGLCAVTIPVGLDDAGMPVGLQLVAAAGEDEALLAAALKVEQVLGIPRVRIGSPPGLSESVPAP